MRIIELVAFLLFLIFPLSALALVVDDNSSEPISFEEFHYQRALYFFLKKDYSTSSEITSTLLYSPIDKRNKIILLSKLSDTKMYYSNRGYPRYVTQNISIDRPDLLLMLNAIYEKGTNIISSTISDEIKSQVLSSYFDGMILLEQNQIEDAEKKIRQVPEFDIFYPYARIALAQIHMMKNNLDDAELYLEKLLSDTSITENMRNRVHLLIAQTLFKKGLYQKALNKFLIIPQSTVFTKSALIGQVWSHIKLNNVDKAISVIKKINPRPPYDDQEQSIQLTLGHLYIKSGKSKQAIKNFQKLNNTITENDEYVLEIFNDSNRRIRYISKLLDIESAYMTNNKKETIDTLKFQPSNKGKQFQEISGNSDFQIYYRSLLLGKTPSNMLEYEKHYLKILGQNSKIIVLINQYKHLSNLEAAYKSSEKKFKKLERYMINTKKGLTNRLTKIGTSVRLLKYILSKTVQKANLSIFTIKKPEAENLSFFSSLEVNITDQWQHSLERKFTKYEKKSIDMILQEGAEALQCPSLSVICPVIDIIRPGIKQGKRYISKENSELLREITYNLDLMGRDMESIGKGNKIIYEKLLSKIQTRVSEKITENMKALRDFDNIKVGMKDNLAKIDKTKKEIVSLLDTSISDNMLKIRYENSTFKSLIKDGLNIAANNVQK